MPPGDAIPGWGFSPDPGARPSAQRSIPDRLSETWQIYRSHLRLVLELALRIQGVLGLFYAPATVALAFAFEQGWSQGGLFADDPESLRQILARLMPSDALSVLIRGVAPVATVLVVVLLSAAFTWIVLPDPAGDRPVRPGLGAIAARSSAFALPLAVVAIAGIGFSLLEAMVLTPAATLSQVALDVRASEALTGALLGIDILIFVAVILVTYSAARWAVVIPVAVVEHLGFRRALARSSDLSRGHRVTALLSLLAISVATGLLISVVAFGSSFILGFVLGPDSMVGFALCLVATLAILVVSAPLVPILLVVLYRDLRDAADGG